MTTVENPQTTVDALQQQQHPPYSVSGTRTPTSDKHHNDWPPRFQKMDFPKFDGKYDPLTFINRCKSYFIQQRITEEEKVGMASYNLEACAQL